MVIVQETYVIASKIHEIEVLKKTKILRQKKKNWKYNNKDCFKSDVGYQTKDSKDSIKYPIEEKKTRLKYIADESINWYYT